jgi:hypothetical protein
MRRLLAAAVALFACAGAPAQKLDDSPSPKRRIDAEPRWLHNEGYIGSPERLNALVATVASVEVRLNTAAHVGKRGRIYLVMPQLVQGVSSPNAVRLEWRARGAFQSGSALPGEKALLYDGPVTAPITGDVLDFNVHIDARYQQAPVRFEPTFEFVP